VVTIAEAEDGIVARLRETFGARVKEVEHRPEPLDVAQLQHMLSMAPALYVAFLSLAPRTQPDGTWDARFGIYVSASNAAGEAARRRGDPATIGAYELSEYSIRALHDWAPDWAAGAVQVTHAEVLAAAAFEKMGRTVHGVVLQVPIVFPRGVDPALLTPFQTFDASWDVPEHGNVQREPMPPPDAGTGAADARDRVLLPQD
jgi:hypothetical protein